MKFCIKTCHEDQSELIIIASAIQQSNKGMIALVSFRLKAILNFFITFDILMQTIFTKIHIVSPIIWLTAATSTNVSDLANFTWALPASITAKCMMVLRFFSRLKVATMMSSWNALYFRHKQDWVLIVVELFIPNSLLNAVAASEVILCLRPLAPIQRVFEGSFAVRAVLRYFWNFHTSDCLFSKFNIVKWWNVFLVLFQEMFVLMIDIHLNFDLIHWGSLGGCAYNIDPCWNKLKFTEQFFELSLITDSLQNLKCLLLRNGFTDLLLFGSLSWLCLL